MAIPSVLSVTPNTGPSSGGTTVNVTGANFIGANLVAFGDASASFTVNSPSSLTAFSPAHVPGTVDVRVSNADGTSPPSAGDLYFYTGSPPTVTGVSPSQGPTSGGTTVTVTGSGFLTATAVTFGGVSASFTINSDTQITAFSPAGTPGTVDVQVTNADGTSAPTPPDQFTYLAITPVVSSLSANTGPSSGGTTITITGTGFLSAGAVYFGDAPAPAAQAGPAASAPPGQGPGPAAPTAAAFVILSPTQIRVFSPPHAPGTVHVRVRTADGTSAPTAADQFTYQ